MPNPNPNAQPSKLTPRIRWNATAGRYIQRDGTFVPQANVKRAVERQVQQGRNNMRRLSEQLQAGEIDLREWRTGMLREIKTVHVASTVAARGGWAQMEPADWGRAGRSIREQYDYLNRFASEVQYGKQKLDGRFLQRADLYGKAGRASYEKERQAQRKEQGMTEERNRLHPADHCKGCLAETAQGWVPIGTLTPIGERDCLGNCQCSMQYR